MRRFTRSILAVGLAVLGMMATNTPPASAASTGTIDFSVIITTPPLSYPPNNPVTNGGISITTTEVCVGASVGKKVNAGVCVINGAGTIGASATGVGAFCGHSAGTISGTIHMTGPLGTSNWWHYTIHFVTAGGVVAATGTVTDPNTGQTGPIVVDGTAIPTGDPVTNPGGGSCLAGTANQFRVVGTADFAKA